MCIRDSSRQAHSLYVSQDLGKLDCELPHLHLTQALQRLSCACCSHHLQTQLSFFTKWTATGNLIKVLGKVDIHLYVGLLKFKNQIPVASMLMK